MITINETNFPDANFRNWLLAQDYGKDGVLTEEDIKGITVIDVAEQDISSLKGIEHFTALTELRCFCNELTSLNVSGCTALTILYCSDNQLTTLDVSGCTALTELRCFCNKLTDLDLSGYTALKELHCFENNLTNLDVSGCAALKELCCNLNELTGLDLSGCTALTILDCEKNKLTSLNISGCTALKKLYCNLNKLTDLDLSECTALTAIDCSDNKNELTILELSKQLQTATAGNAESTLTANAAEEPEPYDPKHGMADYHYPTLSLLKEYDGNDKPHIDLDEQTANKNRIVEVLRNFGIKVSAVKATVGHSVTLYEITPAEKVRMSKIHSLEDDIALSLAALGIRIIAPIPGKGTIGIEMPNAKPTIVSMESVLNSKKFQESTMELPCAIGKTIDGEVFMFDLAKAPHLLIAGATGQGKSVVQNAILTSLLYKKHPAEMKIVLIDPLMVEFSTYKNIDKHFLATIPEEQEDPIITDVTKAVRTLNSLCMEMDARYELLMAARARNIQDYNRKFTERQLNPEQGHKYMPYIVVAIDEFGALIMTAGKEIELPIARIAQKSRAVGIHLIIATQRPTTDIITGTIKANFPARMALKVGRGLDSMVILDRMGANQLIGRGDMLFLQGSDPIRVQCAFVDTPEVVDITRFIACQPGYAAPFCLPEPPADENGDNGVSMTHLDPLFEDAARLIVMSQCSSTSLVQRKFSIGYNRGCRLMDQLEKAGVVGKFANSKPREVLIKDEASLTALLDNLKKSNN